MNNKELLQFIIIPLAILLITWLANYFYRNLILIRPRLHLKIGKTLYQQAFLGLEDGRHHLIWRHECVLKNNSEYPAYEIEIYEAHNKNANSIIDNFDEIKREIPINSHLASHETKEFIIKKEYTTEPDELLNFIIEDGNKVYLPGLKISNPQIYFKPKEFDDIKLIVKYKNSKGKLYYTKVSKKNKIEKNTYHFFRSYWFYNISK